MVSYWISKGKTFTVHKAFLKATDTSGTVDLLVDGELRGPLQDTGVSSIDSLSGWALHRSDGAAYTGSMWLLLHIGLVDQS
jgi:hypothetical protein